MPTKKQNYKRCRLRDSISNPRIRTRVDTSFHFMSSKEREPLNFPNTKTRQYHVAIEVLSNLIALIFFPVISRKKKPCGNHNIFYPHYYRTIFMSNIFLESSMAITVFSKVKFDNVTCHGISEDKKTTTAIHLNLSTSIYKTHSFLNPCLIFKHKIRVRKQFSCCLSSKSHRVCMHLVVARVRRGGGAES